MSFFKLWFAKCYNLTMLAFSNKLCDSLLWNHGVLVALFQLHLLLPDLRTQFPVVSSIRLKMT